MTILWTTDCSEFLGFISTTQRFSTRLTWQKSAFCNNLQRNTGQERRRFYLPSTPFPLPALLRSDMISCWFHVSPGDMPAYSRRILYFRWYCNPLWRVVPYIFPEACIAPSVCFHMGDIRVKFWSFVQGLDRLAGLWEWPRLKKHSSFA
jgi:hypothetical protein